APWLGAPARPRCARPGHRRLRLGTTSGRRAPVVAPSHGLRRTHGPASTRARPARARAHLAPSTVRTTEVEPGARAPPGPGWPDCYYTASFPGMLYYVS